jgi:hypothetical protein
MRLADYAALGGHMDCVRPLEEVLARGAWHHEGAPMSRQWALGAAGNPWPLGRAPLLG